MKMDHVDDKDEYLDKEKEMKHVFMVLSLILTGVALPLQEANSADKTSNVATDLSSEEIREKSDFAINLTWASVTDRLRLS